MKVKLTCKTCGHQFEKDLADSSGEARFDEAFRVIQQQRWEHVHPEASDSLNLKIDWEE